MLFALTVCVFLLAVSNNIVLQRMFFIQGLPTGTDYQLRVKAQNSAGLTTAEYHMRISNEVGGKIDFSSHIFCFISH